MRRTRSTASDPIIKILKGVTKQGYNIPQEYHEQIIQTTQEQIRVLLSKAPQPRSQYDSPETRSAVVLEYVLRKGIPTKEGKGAEFHLHVPLASFGKEIGHSKKTMTSVANGLRGYIDDSSLQPSNEASVAMGSSQGKGSSRLKKFLKLGSNDAKPKVTRTKPTGKPSTPLRKQMEDAKNIRSLSKHQKLKAENASAKQHRKLLPVRPIHMHELSIRLQSKLHDPDTCEKAATMLFLQLAKHIISNPELKTMGRRQMARAELTKNLRTYEASCFFVTAKEMEQGEGNLTLLDISSGIKDQIKDHPSRKARPNLKKRKKLIVSDFDSDDDENDTIITVDDIAGYLKELPSQVSSFLKDILPQVNTLRAAKKSVAEQQRNNTYANTGNLLDIPGKIDPDEVDTRSSRQALIDSIVHTVGEEDLKGAAVKDGTTGSIRSQVKPNNCSALYRNQDVFIAWKEGCLTNLVTPGEGRNDSICDEIMKKYLTAEEVA
jgi:hypothetical protein